MSLSWLYKVIVPSHPQDDSRFSEQVMYMDTGWLKQLLPYRCLILHSDGQGHPSDPSPDVTSLCCLGCHTLTEDKHPNLCAVTSIFSYLMLEIIFVVSLPLLIWFVNSLKTVRIGLLMLARFSKPFLIKQKHMKNRRHQYKILGPVNVCLGIPLTSSGTRERRVICFTCYSRHTYTVENLPGNPIQGQELAINTDGSTIHSAQMWRSQWISYTCTFLLRTLKHGERRQKATYQVIKCPSPHRWDSCLHDKDPMQRSSKSKHVFWPMGLEVCQISPITVALLMML